MSLDAINYVDSAYGFAAVVLSFLWIATKIALGGTKERGL